MKSEKKEYQKAIDYLCMLVEKDELSIGSKLPTERKIAETVSIGRNSTREALRMLENMGVIESRQGSGNYLVGNMSQTITGIIEMMLLLKQTNQSEVISFRRTLEKAICNSILTQGTITVWQDKIAETLAVDFAALTLEEQIEHDRSFHYLLIQATENQLWISISEAIVTIYRRWIDDIIRNVSSNVKEELQESHHLIFQALQNGSRDDCEKAIDHHYDLIEEQIFSNT